MNIEKLKDNAGLFCGALGKGRFSVRIFSWEFPLFWLSMVWLLAGDFSQLSSGMTQIF
jgi:hypothetical protein